MRRLYFIACIVSIAAAMPTAIANMLPATPPPGFDAFSQFPTSAFGYGVMLGNLPDGRFVLYDGDQVKVQTGRGEDGWQHIASGYAGDATFCAVSPSGRMALLGGGYNGKIFRLDLIAPQDYSPAADCITGLPNYWAVFLDETRVFVEATPVWGSSEIQLADFSSGVPVLRKVLDKPGHYGAAFALSPRRDLLYATAGDTGEVRIFHVSALLDAFAADVPLTWMDGAVLGTYNKGGVSAVSSNGTLIAGTWENSVQFIDSTTGEIAGLLDPDPVGYNSYVPFYNHVTNTVYIVSTVWEGFAPTVSAYGSQKEYEPIPAVGALGLLILASGIAGISIRRLRR